jgi:N-acetylglutamate synthase-like GNAT family acetyltransferase
MIRHATKYDMPALLEMMRDYSAQAPQEAIKNKDVHNEAHVKQVFTNMLAGKGFVLIDDEQRGFIAAMVTTNIWCPEVYELHELAWWVKPEHRTGTLGGRLWREFNRIAQDMIEDGRIDVACTSVLANSQFIDYSKRGYKLMQATFFKEQTK